MSMVGGKANPIQKGAFGRKRSTDKERVFFFEAGWDNDLV